MTELTQNSIQNYIQDKKVLYKNLYEFLDPSTCDIEEKYQNLNQAIKDHKIKETKYDLLLFINIIVKISDNINRYPTFFDRISKILLELKETIKQTFTNHELFNIFKNNKINLLFLLREKIITIDNFIIDIIHSKKYEEKQYPSYFAPEIAEFKNCQVSDELFNTDPKIFEENRQNGENPGEIELLIRKDLIDEFITYVKQNDYQLNSIIKKSLFETNSYLIKNKPTLIEYASFYGSVQIFKYLYKNGAKFKPSLWIYAIHSDSAELINFLDENQIKPEDETFFECYYESIKCHHNEMALYIMNNYITNESQLINKELYFKYYNFQYIECNDIETKSLFLIACKYNYEYIVKILLETSNVDVNSILNTSFYSKTLFRYKFLKKPNIKMSKLKTALIMAVENCSIDVVQLLLTNENIDVNKPGKCFSNEEGFENNEEDLTNDDRYRIFYSCNSPLTIAIENNYIEIAKLLLSHSNIDVNCKHIIKDRSNDNMDIKSALILAIQNDELDIVKLLLANQKINVNDRSIKKEDDQYEEKTPLCFAIENERIEIIKEILLSKNIDINSEQLIKISYPYENVSEPTCKTIESALNLAIKQGKVDIIKLLISHPNISLYDQFSQCIEYMSKMNSWIEYKMGGGWRYIMPLIREVMNYPGYDFKLLNKVNTTALCQAILTENYEITKVILSSEQCNVNAKITKTKYSIKENRHDPTEMDKWIWSKPAKSKISALCIAIEKNNTEIVRLLLSSPKINVNEESVKESYHYSCEEEENEEEEDKNESEKEVEWTLMKEINTPLHIAVKNANIDIIKLLLQHKEIDLNKIDNQNKRAVDYADDNEIKKLFLEFK